MKRFCWGEIVLCYKLILFTTVGLFFYVVFLLKSLIYNDLNINNIGLTIDP